MAVLTKACSGSAYHGYTYYGCTCYGSTYHGSAYPGAAGETVALQLVNLQLPGGTRVTACNLVESAEYNGRIGSVASYDLSSGRCAP